MNMRIPRKKCPPLVFSAASCAAVSGGRCFGYPIEHRVHLRGFTWESLRESIDLSCVRPYFVYSRHANKTLWARWNEIFSLSYTSLFLLQDALLKQLVSNAEQQGLRWDIIASQFPDRSDVQCQQRWAKVVNPELVKGPWTKEVGSSC